MIVHTCVSCLVNNTAIRTISYSSAVMDDLILCSSRLQLILPLQPEHFCLIMLFCELPSNCCWRFQISWLPFSEKAARLSPAFAYLIRHRRCLPGDTETHSGVKRPVFIRVTALMSISAMDHLTHVDRSGVDPRWTSYPGYIVDAAS